MPSPDTYARSPSFLGGEFACIVNQPLEFLMNRILAKSASVAKTTATGALGATLIVGVVLPTATVTVAAKALHFAGRVSVKVGDKFIQSVRDNVAARESAHAARNADNHHRAYDIA